VFHVKQQLLVVLNHSIVESNLDEEFTFDLGKMPFNISIAALTASADILYETNLQKPKLPDWLDDNSDCSPSSDYTPFYSADHAFFTCLLMDYPNAASAIECVLKYLNNPRYNHNVKTMPKSVIYD